MVNDIFDIQGDELVKIKDGYVQDVVIPEGVRIIGERAFKGSMIKNIVFPSTLEIIGREAFYQCSLLRSVTIPSNVKVIMDSAFCDCASLESIYFEDGVKIIPASMCMDCNRLQTVRLPMTTQVIQRFAFANCQRLENLELPKSLISISSAAFYDSDYLLENLGLADMELGGGYFADSDLENLVFVKDNASISAEHHWWGSKIKRIIFGGDVKRIGDIEAGYLETLQMVVFPQDLESIGRLEFTGCSSLEEFRAPLCLKKINSFAFSSCGKLEKVVLGDKFEFVDSFAFKYCVSLKEINLPKGYYPEDNVFSECEYVNSIRCHHENLTSSIPFTKPTQHKTRKIDTSKYDLQGIELRRKIIGAQLFENGDEIQVKPILIHYMHSDKTDLSYVCYDGVWYKYSNSNLGITTSFADVITFDQLCQDLDIDGDVCYARLEKIIKETSK